MRSTNCHFLGAIGQSELAPLIQAWDNYRAIGRNMEIIWANHG
jgi:hypothetical protein